MEYFNEGQYQHHCVRTYLDRYDSIIISVRRDHTTNPKRMTVEFGFGNHTIKDYSAPRMLQAQMKYNHTPTDEWGEILEELNKRFNTFKDLKKPKIEIYNKISGKKLIFDREKNEYPKTYENIIADDLPF